MTGGSDAPGSRRWALASFVALTVVVTGGAVTLTEPFGTDSSNADAGFPPGTSADGVENVSRLVDAHRTALATAGTYRVEQRINASRPRGSPRPDRWKWNQTARHRFDVASPTPRFVQRRTVARPDSRVQVEVFATPSVWYTRARPSDGEWNTGGKTRNLTAETFRAWALDHTLDASLSKFAFAYDGRSERGNATVYRSRVASISANDAPASGASHVVDDASATILVDERGLILGVDVRYAGTAVASVDGGERTVDVSVRYRRSFRTADGLTVAEPEWVTARRESVESSRERPRTRGRELHRALGAQKNVCAAWP
ncbi:hypothetical protein [Halogeometricum sp. CBA1124]|uniref:hypothetical protein n=1 Tax=Halogeometricum sp. CBA1124 TaxID=2668071 RepID=UPI00142CDC61|nr:hypothetical protein [Halogeometricum sp. CBA1124]MUV56404.1 hypothetical protein [Halogeometricum sp. CBA1124]